MNKQRTPRGLSVTDYENLISKVAVLENKIKRLENKLYLNEKHKNWKYGDK